MCRHVPPGRQSAVKVASALLLALVAVLVPVDAPRTPGIFADMIGSDAAAAQSSSGTPTTCPDPMQAALDWPDPHDDAVMNQGIASEWQPQPGDPDDPTSALCVMEIPPCPPVPWAADPAVFLQVSPEFPDFCEIVIDTLNPTLGHLYADCAASTASTTAYVTDDGMVCTARAPKQCLVGLRIAHETCRVVQRRNWTCAPPLLRGNGFNTCFEERSPVINPALHPACGSGAPSLGSVSCADYASTDYLDAPGAQRCDGHASYLTGLSPPSLEQIQPVTSASEHWCTYDARQLDVRCHTDPAQQPYQDGQCGQAQSAYCLKRSGDTGGCNGVAHTIRCAVLIAPHLSGYQDADDPADLRAQGCTPCIVLPFSPSVTSCPDDIAEDPYLGSVRPIGNLCGPTETEILQARASLDFVAPAAGHYCGSLVHGGVSLTAGDIIPHTVCPDPASGSLSWGSNHLAGRAVVNTPVTFRVDHVPMQTATLTYLRERGRLHSQTSDPILDDFAWPLSSRRGPGWSARSQVVYGGGSDVVHYVGTPNTGVPANSLTDLVGSMCTLEEEPAFLIEIEPLWPDVDRAEIETNFDVDLQWWSDLPEQEQERLTTLRGYRWIGPTVPPSDPDRLAEIERRQREVGAVGRCNSTHFNFRYPFPGPVSYALPLSTAPQRAQSWCRWSPEHSGWYRVTALGAWHARVPPSPRWKSANEIQDWVDFLNSGTFPGNRNPGIPFDAYILPYTTDDETLAANPTALPWFAWCWRRDNVTQTCDTTKVQQSLFYNGFVPGPADYGLMANPDGTFMRPVRAMPIPSLTDPNRDDELYRFGNGAYRADIARRSRFCPSMDIRIECDHGTQRVGKFTESEPVYISVHEVRTRSVPTSP